MDANMIFIKVFIFICVTLGQRVFADENDLQFGIENQIDKILDSLKQQNPNQLLSYYLPELKQIEKVPIERLNQCYNSTLDGETVDIFRETVGDVVRKYFNKFPLNVVDLKDNIKKTEILITNIQKVAGWVLECVLNTDPNYEPLKLGLTQMSIYSPEDFDHFEMPSDLLEMGENKCDISDVSEEVQKAHKTFDWRDSMEFLVKNIAGSDCHCGYIFAAVAAMEAAYMIKNPQTSVVFSEQALIDCGYMTGTLTHPCQDGSYTSVWKAAKAIAVIAEGDYHPYTGKIGECISSLITTRPTGYCLNRDKITNFEAVVFKYGPAVIGIAANSEKFLHLRGPWTGSAEQCGNRPTTAMTIVGWDEKNWIIRNPWGYGWGVDGYLYLPRNSTNMCAIHESPIGVPFF